jgi:hypothetical protein
MKTSEIIAYHMYKNGAEELKRFYDNCMWGYAAAGSGALTSYIQLVFDNFEGSLYSNLTSSAILLGTLVAREVVFNKLQNAPIRGKELEEKILEEFGEIPDMEDF